MNTVQETPWPRRPRVLVVDDDSVIRRTLEAALSERYEIRCAPSGEGLLALLEGFDPDLVVLDQNLPGESGTSLCRRIRAAGRRRRVPVLFLTANREAEGFLQAFDEGADAYLTKPFEMEELRDRMDFLLVPLAAHPPAEG